MSKINTTRDDMLRVLAYWACLGGGAYELYDGKETTGWGLVICGLILWLGTKVVAHQRATQIKEPAPPAVADDKYGEGTFHLSLTTPELESNSGWESVVVFEDTARYERTLCFGGPPVYKELWEYEIKERTFVFQRLKDDYIDDLWDPRYQAVNGCVQERLIEARHAEDRECMRVSTLEIDIARLREKVQWHEAAGIMRYFILSKLMPYSGWRGEVEKIKEGIVKLGVEAEALGATLDEYGGYQLPDNASDEQKRKLDRLFSPRSMRDHGFRSYKDWSERNHIIKLLEPEPAVTEG